MRPDSIAERYDRVRGRFPERELPGRNFEGCVWFMLNGRWCRDNGEAIMTVLDNGVRVTPGDRFYPDG